MSALTKMFIVLQLVAALVCSVLLVLMVSRQENYKALADDSNTSRIASQAQLAEENRQIAALTASVANKDKQLAQADERAGQAQSGRTNDKSQSDAEISKLNSEIASLQADLQTQTAANSTLSVTNSALNAELGKLRPEVAGLTTQNSELNRVLGEAQNQLRAAEQAIRKLQEQQVAGTGPSGAVAPMGSEGQISTLSSVAPAGKVNGQITEVNTSTGSTIIGLPLGTRDGIEPNTKLFIYRGNGYVGDAVVQRATPDQSVAVVVSTKAGAVVQKGDLVSTVGQ